MWIPSLRRSIVLLFHSPLCNLCKSNMNVPAKPEWLERRHWRRSSNFTPTFGTRFGSWAWLSVMCFSWLLLGYWLKIPHKPCNSAFMSSILMPFLIRYESFPCQKRKHCVCVKNTFFFISELSEVGSSGSAFDVYSYGAGFISLLGLELSYRGLPSLSWVRSEGRKWEEKAGKLTDLHCCLIYRALLSYLPLYLFQIKLLQLRATSFYKHIHKLQLTSWININIYKSNPASVYGAVLPHWSRHNLVLQWTQWGTKSPASV